MIKRPACLSFLLLFLMMLLVSACGASPDNTAVAPVPALPTLAAPEAPAGELVPTAVPSVAPTAVPNVAPAATAAPTATAVPPTDVAAEAVSADVTPTAAGMPLPASWLGPDDFPLGVNPLTGETMEDPAVLDRRPIAIKVSNYPALVRPQAGLNNADLVYEHYAEGGATRFTAVYYGNDAHTVGSVRSARIIDFEIPVMYDAAFGFSGAAGANKERFGQTDWFGRIISPDFGHSGFYRSEPKAEDIDFWHTMFTDTYRLRDILIERGENRRPQFHNGMIFSPEPPEDGTPAKQVEIGYSGSYVTWWFDSGTGRYYRWNDGDKHLDANRNEQLNTKNIAVIAAQHVDTWIPETEVGQGAKSIEIQIWGEGPATIFRDGQRFDGRWRRATPQDMLTFTDLDGNPLPLGIGNTWFELVPLGFDKLYVTS